MVSLLSASWATIQVPTYSLNKTGTLWPLAGSPLTLVPQLLLLQAQEALPRGRQHWSMRRGSRPTEPWCSLPKLARRSLILFASVGHIKRAPPSPASGRPAFHLPLLEDNPGTEPMTLWWQAGTYHCDTQPSPFLL